MAQVLWDAGNILQITQSKDEDKGGTQCVGKAPTRNNNRCGWTNRDEYSEIRNLLSTISKTQPGVVTNASLWQLAILCLCHHHKGQQNEVATRWINLVSAEIQYRSTALRSLQQVDTVSQQTQQSITANEAFIQGDRRELDAERLKLQQFRRSAAETENQLRLELAHWKDRLQRSHDDKIAHEVTISQIQQTNQTLVVDMKNGSMEREQDAKQILTLQKRVRDSDALVTQMKQAYRSFSQDVERESEERELGEKEIVTLEKQLEEADARISQLQQTNHALSTDVKKESSAREQSEKDVLALRDKLEETNTTICQINEKNKDLSIQIEKKATEHDQDGKEIMTLRKKAEEADAVVSGLRHTNKSLSVQVQKELEECEQSEKEILTLQQRLKELDAVISQLQERNQALQMEVEKMSTERKQGEDETGALQKMMEEAEARLRDSDKEWVEVREENKALGLELARVRNEQAWLAEDVKKRHIEAAGSADINQKLTTELEAKDKLLQQSEADLERERARISDLESAIARLKDSERNVKANMSSSWWHRTWMRLAGSRKRWEPKKEKTSSLDTPHVNQTNVLYK